MLILVQNGGGPPRSSPTRCLGRFATDTAAVVAAGWRRALTMPLGERRRRWSAIDQPFLRRNDCLQCGRRTFLDHLLAGRQHEPFAGDWGRAGVKRTVL